MVEGVEGCAFRTQDVEQCVYRARVTVIQAVVILASPPTGLLLQYCNIWTMLIKLMDLHRKVLPPGGL